MCLCIKCSSQIKLPQIFLLHVLLLFSTLSHAHVHLMCSILKTVKRLLLRRYRSARLSFVSFGGYRLPVIILPVITRRLSLNDYHSTIKTRRLSRAGYHSMSNGHPSSR